MHRLHTTSVSTDKNMAEVPAELSNSLRGKPY